MNKNPISDRNLPLRHGIRRGTLIGLLGQTGAWSLVGGVALLIDRSDLPSLSPAGLVGIGLGTIGLSFMLLHRADGA